jgi:hypothetical protein
MIYLLTIVMAHPFEAELYGHDIHVVFQEQSMKVNYRLEVPFDIVQGELTKLVSENRDKSMDILRKTYLSEKYDGITEALSLEIDGVQVSWDQAMPVSDKLKKEERFLIFELHASKSILAGAHQLSIMNENYEDKLSMFRTYIDYEGGFWIDDTDLLTPKQWSKEESMKELRMSIRQLPVWWGWAERAWFSIVYKKKLISYTARESSWQSRFIRGRLLFHEALLLLVLGSFFFLLFPISKKRVGLGVVLGTMGFGVLLAPLHDARIMVMSIAGMLLFSYPAVIVLLVMSVGLPWWFGFCGILSLMRSTITPYAWLFSFGLSLAFFWMFA